MSHHCSCMVAASLLSWGVLGGAPVHASCPPEWAQGPTTDPGARFDHAMAYDAARARVVLFGGMGITQLADTWEYDGTSWTAVPVAGPAAREGHAMAFDATSGRTILFGGCSGYCDHGQDFFDDTWAYDGTAWVQVGSPVRPPWRAWAGLAYDAARGETVLAGGANEGMGFEDSWRLSGGAWSPGPPLPFEVFYDGMAYDAARERIVLLHGRKTLEYDGTTWQLGVPPPAAMASRFFMTVTYDPYRSLVVILGGACCGGRDVWEFDGSSWSPGTTPPTFYQGRYMHAAAYDESRGRVVVFGGTPNVRDGTWEYLSASIELAPLTVPGGRVGAPYSQTFSASGGTPSYAFAISAGALPPGLALSPSGLLAGIPTTPGQFDFDVAATDATWRTCTRSYRMTIIVVGTGWQEDVVAGEGFGPPNPNRVRAIRGDGTPTSVDFLPYAAGSWGAMVSGAELDGSAPQEILTAPGPGPTLGPQVRAFDAGGGALTKVSFYAYGTLRFGADTEGSDLDGDGFAEIVTGAGAGAVFGPHVRGFDYDGARLAPMAGVSFFAYGSLRYGVDVGGGDVDGDGYVEMLTAPGPGPSFAPQVRGFDYDGIRVTPAPVSFAAFPVIGYGADVAGGDVGIDGRDEMVVAMGPGPSFQPFFSGYELDGTVQHLAGFDVTAFGTLYGGRAGLAAVSPAVARDLIAAPGPDPSASSMLRAYAYENGGLRLLLFAPLPFGSSGYGANVAGASLGL